MGVHWVDSVAGELNGRPFDQTLLYGFTGGKMIFVEPMITKAFLESRPNFSAAVKLPQAFQRAGRYPHRDGIRYDAAARVYRISMDELTAHSSARPSRAATGAAARPWRFLVPLRHGCRACAYACLGSAAGRRLAPLLQRLPPSSPPRAARVHRPPPSTWPSLPR